MAQAAIKGTYTKVIDDLHCTWPAHDGNHRQARQRIVLYLVVHAAKRQRVPLAQYMLVPRPLASRKLFSIHRNLGLSAGLRAEGSP